MEKSWKVSCVGLVALAIIIAITMFFSSPVSAEEAVTMIQKENVEVSKAEASEKHFTAEELKRLEAFDRELRFIVGYLAGNGIENVVRYYLPDETVKVSDLYVPTFNSKEYPADEFGIYMPRTVYLNEIPNIKELKNNVNVIWDGQEISLLKGDKYYVVHPNTELAAAVFRVYETESAPYESCYFGETYWESYEGFFWQYANCSWCRLDEEVLNGEALIRQSNSRITGTSNTELEQEEEEKYLQAELLEIGQYLNRLGIKEVLKYWLDEGSGVDYCEIRYAIGEKSNYKYAMYIERPIGLNEIGNLYIARDENLANTLYEMCFGSYDSWENRHVKVVYQGKHASLIRLDGVYMITLNTYLARDTFLRYETQSNLMEEDVFAKEFLVYEKEE